MKKIMITFLTALLATPLLAQQAPAQYLMTLEDCLDYAMGNSYTRQSQQLSEQSAEIGYDQSKLERLPSLSASAGENMSNTNNGTDATWRGTYDVSASMTLYQGGSINNTIKQNKLYTGQASAQTAQYDNELTIQILQSFLTILGNEELLKYQESVIAASEEQVEQGRLRLMAQDILESDYLMLEAQLASDRNNIVDTRAARENNLLSLKALLSMNLDTDLEIIYPDTTSINAMAMIPSRNYVTGRAMSSLPDLDILQYGVEIAQTKLDIAKAAYSPTLSLTGSIGTGHQPNFSAFGDQLSNRFNQQAGLSLSIPIFNKGRTRSQVKQTQISLQQVELEQQQSELNILQTIIQEYHNVETALSSYRTSEVKENAYRKTFDVYRAQFNEGVITAVDLLQQQNNYINALNEYIQNKYGFMLKRKVLDVYMGEIITM